MRVLVACEFSGRVRDEFTKLGFDAWSCDLLPSESPGNHYEGDVFDIINDGWDLMIAHPPCTYLSSVANRFNKEPKRLQKREIAMQFFMQLYNAGIKHICVENPVGYPNSAFRKPDQIIHPYYFGEPYKKRTCLWLKDLPLLNYDNNIQAPPVYYRSNGEKTKGKSMNWVDGGSHGKDRQKSRSRTFPGIAKAMARQWGEYLLSNKSVSLFESI